MVRVYTSPQAKVAADIYERVKAVAGIMKATSWLLAGCAILDGMSPIQAIKAGRESEVSAAADWMIEKSKKC